MPANLENSAVATGLEKVSFHSIPKKGNAKECSHYRTIALISHTSKIMLKILQGRLQQYMNRELPDVQAGFRKGRRTKESLDESEREWKSWLKAQHSENYDHGIQSPHFMGNRWGNSGNGGWLFLEAPKLLQMVISAMKLKDTYSLEGKLWAI